MLKTVGLPAPGGGPGTLGPTQRRTLKGNSLRASSPSRMQAATKPQPAAYDSNVQEEKIRNLQQQVFFLEQKLRALQDYHSSTERAHVAKPQDLHAIRDERVRQLEARHDELKEEALRATFREKTTHAEKVKAVEQLSLARDQFATQRQELTAEVVNLQRELEHSYLREKTVHTELEQLLQQYASLKAFNEGADTKVKELESQIEEQSATIELSHEREESLRKQVGAEQIQVEALQTKLQTLNQRNQTLDEQRKGKVKEAEEAAAKLRLVQIELEQERKARTLSGEQHEYLVCEKAKMDTALAELDAQCKALSLDNAKLRSEEERSKMTRVLGRFLIRKWRDKMDAARVAQKHMEGRVQELHRDRVKERQRTEAASEELAQVRRRAHIMEEHYRQQEEDASKLAQENRLLLEQLQQMGMSNDEHKFELEKAQDQNVELQTQVQMLQAKADLAAALRSLRVEDLQGLSRTNTELSSALMAITHALPKLGV